MYTVYIRIHTKYICSVNLTTCYSIYLCSYILYTTGGALNLPAVLAGAVVAFLLLTLLIAGVIVGAVLLGRAKRKVTISQSNMTPPKSGRTEIHRAAEVHIYDDVGDDTPALMGKRCCTRGWMWGPWTMSVCTLR